MWPEWVHLHPGPEHTHKKEVRLTSSLADAFTWSRNETFFRHVEVAAPEAVVQARKHGC